MPATEAAESAVDAQSARADAIALAERELKAARRMLRLRKAKDDLISFTELMMPSPEDPDNPELSRYLPVQHHKIIAAALQEVEKGNILRLIISLPPRAGKTELCSKKFIPWMLGRNAYKHVIFATYNEDFARDIGKEVRETLRSPGFRQVFPACVLRPGNSASDRVQTKEGGIASFVGRGGSITGRGGDCVLGGTLVTTSVGKIPIRELKDIAASINVLSYDLHGESLTWQKIEALSRRSADGFYRITTSTGRVVEATAEHPFFVGGEWRKASSLTPGDRLVLALQKVDSEDSFPAEQAREKGVDGVLLRERLRLQSLQREGGEIGQFLPDLRTKEPQPPGSVLLPEMSAGDAGKKESEDPLSLSNLHLPSVQHSIRESLGLQDILRPEVCRRSPCVQNDEHRQPWLEKRNVSSSPAEAQREGVPVSQAEDFGNGPAGVRSVRFDQGIGSSSHLPQPIRQPLLESGDDVRDLSHETPWRGAFQTEEDSVALVEFVCEPTDVWNIQVAGNENFFANDVLVHNCLIADDLIKDSEEAGSQSFRAKLWEWFTRVFLTRKMNSGSAVIIVMTRWHEDDPIGRLTDPQNECYNAEEAAKWKILSLPAIAVENDPMGRAPGEVLWPERFPLEFLQAVRALDPKGFASLYQGQPAPEDGDFFKKAWLKTYKPSELPKNLRYYAASDHAVATGQKSDLTCLMPVGLDEHGVIWILPDVWWYKKQTDDVAEAMLDLMERHKPLTWWAEKGHISQSIGPFLRKRMLERLIFCNIEESTPAKDKQTRAQAIQARMSMGMVRFPGFAPWWNDAEQELLKFPSARHDDFVDALAWIGLGLAKAISANRMAPPKIEGVRPGSMAWIKEDSKFQAMSRQRKHADGY